MLEALDSCSNYNITGNCKCECLKITIVFSNQQPSLFKMRKVHRLCTNYNHLILYIMVTFKERAEELANQCKRVKGNNVYETLAKEFNIGKRTAGDRFKSMFGLPVRDYISNNIIPTKEEMIDFIIQSNSFEELYRICGINDSARLVSILNEYFKQSNFTKIKFNLVAKIPSTIYKVTREDNMSILISQYLGDGHIEREGGFKIEHCDKQYQYLKFKVGLLNKAFPYTNGLEAIRKRLILDKRTGKNYVSYAYRTREVLKSQLKIILGRSIRDNIHSMTPLGVCLYYMDDGYLGINNKYRTVELSFSVSNSETQDYLIEYFKTYGFYFNKNSKAISLNKKVEVLKFIQNFILPFDYMLPECMKYKYDYKDIVGLMH